MVDLPLGATISSELVFTASSGDHFKRELVRRRNQGFQSQFPTRCQSSWAPARLKIRLCRLSGTQELPALLVGSVRVENWRNYEEIFRCVFVSAVWWGAAC